MAETLAWPDIDYMTDTPSVQAIKARSWAQKLSTAEVAYYVSLIGKNTFWSTKPMRAEVLREAARRLAVARP